MFNAATEPSMGCGASTPDGAETCLKNVSVHNPVQIIAQASDHTDPKGLGTVYYARTTNLANTGMSATLIRTRGTNEYTLALRSTEIQPPEKGDDTVYAASGDDRVLSGSGGDVLHGEAGNDRLQGEVGRDSVHGDDGDDAPTAEAIARTINSLKGKATILFIAHQVPKGLAIDEIIQIGVRVNGVRVNGVGVSGPAASEADLAAGGTAASERMEG
jgi:Ca2+-binding RTX toxin-like protein